MQIDITGIAQRVIDKLLAEGEQIRGMIAGVTLLHEEIKEEINEVKHSKSGRDSEGTQPEGQIPVPGTGTEDSGTGGGSPPSN